MMSVTTSGCNFAAMSDDIAAASDVMATRSRRGVSSSTGHSHSVRWLAAPLRTFDLIA